MTRLLELQLTSLHLHGMTEPPRPIRPPGEDEPEKKKPKPAPLPSVRDVMGDPKGDEEAATGSERTFEVEGREWAARVIGSRKSGAPNDAGAPLLLLRFEPTEGGEGETREGWVVAFDLDRLGDHALVEALSRARA